MHRFFRPKRDCTKLWHATGATSIPCTNGGANGAKATTHATANAAAIANANATANTAADAFGAT
jgi:hypothetical protein